MPAGRKRLLRQRQLHRPRPHQPARPGRRPGLDGPSTPPHRPTQCHPDCPTTILLRRETCPLTTGVQVDSAAPPSEPPLLRTGDGGWLAYGGGDQLLTVNHGTTHGQYHQPHEFYDMRYAPEGWRSPEYHANGGGAAAAADHADDDKAHLWESATVTAPFGRIASKGAAGIRLDTVAAAGFHSLPHSAAGDCYVVDFGGIIQGAWVLDSQSCTHTWQLYSVPPRKYH
jgi:hypothetical protein